MYNPFKPSGHYMYRQFNIQQFYVLHHTVCLCVLCGSQNKQRLFPYTTLTVWFFFITETSVYCAVRTQCLNIIQVHLRLERDINSNRWAGFKKISSLNRTDRERDTRSGLSKRQFTIRERVNRGSSVGLHTQPEVHSIQQTCCGCLQPC